MRAHLLAVVQPARRDRAQVVDVEDVVPAGRLGERHLRFVGDEVLDEAVPDALVEVAHVLRDDHAAPHAECDRVERRTQHHVGVYVQHKRLLDLRLLRPVHDGRRLVVRAGRLVVVRVVEHVRVDERRPHGHAARRILAPLLVGAREQPRDLTRHP